MNTTLLYAGLLGLWFLVLSIRVIQGRGKIPIGDGGDPQMLRLMRGHANFAEYVPLILIMMALLESRGLSQGWIHLLGLATLIGRLLHGYAFAFSAHFPPGRLIGTTLTLLSLLVGSSLAIWQSLN